MTGAMASGVPGLPRVPEAWTIREEDASEWPDAFRDDRRRARAVAVQVLYEIELTKRDPIAVLDRRVIDDLTPVASASVARVMVTGVVARRAEIDRALTDGSPQWPVDRIDPVERSILRLATFELMHGRGDGDRAADRVPVRVAINEAVELARLFGTEASVRFVNGVLGAVVRQVVPDAPALPGASMPSLEAVETDGTGGVLTDEGVAPDGGAVAPAES